jgi:hypothetical protein
MRAKARLQDCLGFLEFINEWTAVDFLETQEGGNALLSKKFDILGT